jgi:hypothetical protein
MGGGQDLEVIGKSVIRKEALDKVSGKKLIWKAKEAQK